MGHLMLNGIDRLVGDASKNDVGKNISVWAALVCRTSQIASRSTVTTSCQWVRKALRLLLSLIDSVMLAIGNVSVLTLREDNGLRLPNVLSAVSWISIPLGTPLGTKYRSCFWFFAFFGFMSVGREIGLSF